MRTADIPEDRYFGVYRIPEILFGICLNWSESSDESSFSLPTLNIFLAPFVIAIGRHRDLDKLRESREGDRR